MRRLFLYALGCAAVGAAPAAALPAFAVQTGQQCAACHVGGFGPQLTPFGRQFKLSGYTMRTNKGNIPVSAMAIASFVKTKQDQSPAPGYSANDNSTLDQFSIFIAGGLGSHFGGFSQTTYDGVAKIWHWDNLDLRAVTNVTLAGKPTTIGMSFNNAPSVQDAFNTLPAWGYLYTSSTLAPTPGTSPVIGSFAQNTVGLTAYAWINSTFLVEAGGYRSPTPRFLTRWGIDPTNPGQIAGTAPYVRAAFQKNYGDHNFEVGAYYFHANIYPGLDQTTGFTDHFTDIGVDGSFQKYFDNGSIWTVNGRYTHEAQDLYATQALGGAVNVGNTLQELRFDTSYYWHGYVGATFGAFNTWGSRDDLLYSGNRTFRPDSTGLLFQLDGTPFGHGGSPFGPRFNMRVGVQYTAYLRFNGSSSNVDGMGQNASDNNTFRVFTWIAY